MDFQRLKEILPKDPIMWTQEDVIKWLEFIGLEKYASEFQGNTIDGSCLCSLSDDELKDDLKISSSIQRKKFMNWISVGLKSYSQMLKQSNEDDFKLNQLVLSELNSNSQKILIDDKGKINNHQKKPSNMQQFEETNISNPQHHIHNQVPYPNEENFLFEQLTNNHKLSYHNNNKSSNYPINVFHSDYQAQRLPQCNGKLDSSSEEDKENLDDLTTENKNYKGDNGIFQQEMQQQNISAIVGEPSQAFNFNDDPSFLNIQNLNQNSVNMLIIEPVEGVQTNFFCVKETGGKIGRHSTNQILILEESISRHHAEIVFRNKKFYIKDIGSSTGTFIKIKDRVPIKLGMIFEMGSYQFEVTNLNSASKTIQLTNIEESENHTEYNLEIKPNGESPDCVSIGRRPSNSIILPNDQHLSNVHAKIYMMNDSFYLEDNCSTNGSWIRLSKETQMSEEWEVQNNMVIKIGTTSSYNCRIENKLEKADRELGSESCVICCEADKDAIFQPCRHNSACMKCSKTLSICPICRTKIEKIEKIYKV